MAIGADFVHWNDGAGPRTGRRMAGRALRPVDPRSLRREAWSTGSGNLGAELDSMKLVMRCMLDTELGSGSSHFATSRSAQAREAPSPSADEITTSRSDVFRPSQ